MTAAAPDLQKFARHYVRIGLGLVPMPHGTKGPRAQGWNAPENAITTTEAADSTWKATLNMGVLHNISGTCTLDVDKQEWAEMALAAIGLSLTDLQAFARCSIRGANGSKPFYRVPEGLTLNRHALAWPHPTEVDDQGRPVMKTVFELRAGPVQDVLPPSLHPSGIRYTWEGQAPRSRDEIEELPRELLDLWLRWDDLLAAMRAACPWAPAVATPAPRSSAPRAAGPFQGESVIDAWNERTDLQAVMERHSYKFPSAHRAIYPGSTTKIPGVVILKGQDGQERAYSHHPGDPLHNGHAHTSFGAYCLLEHGGDVRAAVKAAAAELGMTHTPERQSAPTVSLEAAKSDWSEKGTELFERAMDALDQTTMHHHARKAFNLLLAHVYDLAANGKLQIVQGEVCVMVGGLNGLASDLTGRPHDAAARLRLAASLGFLGPVRHTDPSDKRSALMIPVPADPFQLPFLRLTSEGLHQLNLRPATVDSRRSNTRKQVTPPIQRQSKATPIGGVTTKRKENPLQAALRVALVLSRQPGLTLKQIARAARCHTATARKHLGVLQAAGLAEGTRLTVTFRQYFQAVRAAVADRTAARLKGFLELSAKFAEHSLRLARFGVAECQRTAPARRRLLLRSRELLDSMIPYEVAA